MNIPHHVLRDQVEHNQQFPEAYHIPTKEEIKRYVKVGSYVKITLLATKEKIESVWFRIDEIGEDHQTFTGTVNNDCAFRHLHGFDDGDQFVITIRHIKTILVDGPAPAGYVGPTRPVRGNINICCPHYSVALEYRD